MRRALGRTGITVPALTIGTAGLARDPAQAEAMLARALDHGIDTIELDAGDAETVALLGALLRRTGMAHRVQMLVRTPPRAPLDLPSPHMPVAAVYPGAQLRATIEALLAALGRSDRAGPAPRMGTRMAGRGRLARDASSLGARRHDRRHRHLAVRP